MAKQALIARIALAATATLLTSGSANAQAWIGQVVGNMIAQEQAAQQEAACRGGQAMPDSEIAETRASAYAAINGYWNAVRGGTAADVSPFYQTERKLSWVSGTTTFDAAGLRKVTDPLAQPGAALDAKPLAYLRSGDGATVHGQWAVRRADRHPLGMLDAHFRRAAGQWKLVDLAVHPATEYVDPLVQYCHFVGDVLPYRVASTTQARTYLVKRADKMKAKADKAQAAADQGAARNADAAWLRDQRALADTARLKSDGATKAAQDAIAANEQALTDAKMAADTRAAAIAALKS